MTITTLKDQEAAMVKNYVCKDRVFVSEDGARIVDPAKESGFLLAGAGQPIPEEKARALGLLGGPVSHEVAGEEKQAKPVENKKAKKAANK